MTVTLLTFILINKKISIKNRYLAMAMWNIDKPGGIIRLILQFVLYSLATEILGAIFIALSFVPKYGFGQGLFLSMFTSISAFNNAGFALFKDNLMSTINDPIITITIPLLIIMGGIGPLVFFDLIMSQKLVNLKLHSKIVLSTSLTLIILGSILFFILEYHATLNHLSLPEKIGASFFQSVTTRTAGFNTVDIGHITAPTSMMMMLLMFIGGAPISAAGGIKVTSLVLTLLFITNTLKNETHPSIFKRSISNRTLNIAVTITLCATIFVLSVSLIVSMLNPHTPYTTVLFEVISAFGTVGLSMNFTLDYHTATKIIIIATMLIGKIGILTFVQLFITEKKSLFYYAKGNVHL